MEDTETNTLTRDINYLKDFKEKFKSSQFKQKLFSGLFIVSFNFTSTFILVVIHITQDMNPKCESTIILLCSSSSVICQTHDRSTASSKTIPPLNAI
jgi:hypothetical protein